MTARLVTLFGTVAVYLTVLPVNAGESVPAESASTLRELSAESFTSGAFSPPFSAGAPLPAVPEPPPFALLLLPLFPLPPAFVPLLLLLFPPALPPPSLLSPLLLFPVFPDSAPAAFFTFTVVPLPAMDSSSSFVSKTTPSDAERETLESPAATAFSVMVKLSPVAVTLLPPPP